MLDGVAIKSMMKGLATFLPGFPWTKRREGGGANSARYCYAVWLRHSVIAAQKGLISQPPIVAEFGPGDSIGVGLAALLSGSRSYLAFDIVPFTAIKKNLEVFGELVQLFRQRAPIPDDQEFPALYPRLDHYGFPSMLFPKDHLEEALNETRVETIGRIIMDENAKEDQRLIRYVAPWNSSTSEEANTVDMIFSQAVMEHVDNLDEVYGIMHRWLRPGGIISHEIDFKCHGTATHWNGHWMYSDFAWRIIRGRRPYFLNRQLCSSHLGIIEKTGFDVVHLSRQKREQVFSDEDFCSSLSILGRDDLVTASAHIIAQKNNPS